MEITPIVTEYGVQASDDRAVFPVINRTDEYLVLIPKSDFEIVSDAEATIILRKIYPRNN